MSDDPFWKKMNTRQQRPVFLLCLLLLITVCHASSRTPAEAAFERLQRLAGEWKGIDEHGKQVKSRFELVASDTAVMETLRTAEMNEDMLTLYSLDVDSILLIHYCPTNNQPRMRAIPQPGPVKQLLFSFMGAGNLPDSAAGHEHKLVIQFDDQDHITERWTWRRAGTDTEMVFRLSRKSQMHK